MLRSSTLHFGSEEGVAQGIDLVFGRILHTEEEARSDPHFYGSGRHLGVPYGITSHPHLYGHQAEAVAALPRLKRVFFGLKGLLDCHREPRSCLQGILPETEAPLERFELPTFGFEVRCAIHCATGAY